MDLAGRTRRGEPSDAKGQRKMAAAEAVLTEHRLGGEHVVLTGLLPAELLPTQAAFEALWDLHPGAHPSIFLHGRTVPLPRWQEAYGRNYHFSGETKVAHPVPPELVPYLAWAQRSLDTRLNGLLLNWYDGSLGHYIGKHRDSRRNLVVDAPIVTVSLGETRTMRFRRWKGNEQRDFALTRGSVLVLPYATNLAWTHEITKSARAHGRRISITLRAFGNG